MIAHHPDHNILLGSCDLTSPGADGCFIIDGAVTLNLDSSSDLAAAEDLSRQSIANSMDNGALLDPTNLPEVVYVQYLGETYEDYLVNQGCGSSISCPDVPPDLTGTKDVVVTYAYEVETLHAKSSSEFLPELEREILKELVAKCNSEGFTLVGIHSAPDDVEVPTGKDL
jgi:hypothetical protein